MIQYCMFELGETWECIEEASASKSSNTEGESELAFMETSVLWDFYIRGIHRVQRLINSRKRIAAASNPKCSYPTYTHAAQLNSLSGRANIAYTQLA